jgi:adenosine kinase
MLLGIGNPLLDITVTVTHEYLAKFDLKSGQAILAEPKHMAIYEDCAKDPQVDYCAGGASMNTTRAAQWMLQSRGRSAFVGCIAEDTNGDILRRAVAVAQVQPQFHVVPKTQTGTGTGTGSCAVLVVNKERCLVTHLGAAECYDPKHLLTAQVDQAVRSADVFYAEGYFVTVSVEPLLHLGRTALATGKRLMFNLSAPFLMQFFWDRMAQVLSYVDTVFCNEIEAREAGKRLGLATDDLATIAAALAGMPTASDSLRRNVVITQGKDPALALWKGQLTWHRPETIRPEEIVDTNGAGDSFVGGFIARMLTGGNVEECMAAASYCAGQCIRHVGCKFTGEPTFKL